MKARYPLFSIFLGVVLLSLLQGVPRAAEEDDLELPPLPGEELDLPPLPGEEKTASPVPKPPPPPPVSSSTDPILELPPLPGDEPKAPAKSNAKTEDPLAGLDLPELPGEPAPVPGEKLEEIPDLSDILLETEPPAREPEPELESEVEVEILREEKPHGASAPVVRHNEPKAKAAAKPKVKVPPAPAVASAGARTLPLPGMDFWNAGLLGPLAPKGGQAIWIYGLFAYLLPWQGWGKVIAFLRGKLRKKT